MSRKTKAGLIEVIRYLNELQAAGTGLDPAVVHDMLADAEDHLMAAISAGRSASDAIAEFGKPAEVAAAYRAGGRASGPWASEMLSMSRPKAGPWDDLLKERASAKPAPAPVAPPVMKPASKPAVGPAAPPQPAAAAAATPPPGAAGEAREAILTGVATAVAAGAAAASPGASNSSAPAPEPVENLYDPPAAAPNLLARIPIFGIWAHPLAWRSVGYLLISFIFATVFFTLVFTGVSLSVSLIPVLVGLPLLAATLAMARVLTVFNGRLIEAMLGIRMPRRGGPAVRHGTGVIPTIVAWLTDIRSWLATAFWIGNFPVALAVFIFMVTLLSVGVSLLFAPLATLVPEHAGIHIRPGARIQLLGTDYIADPITGRLPVPPSVYALMSVVGFLLLTATLWLSRAVAWLYGQVVKSIQLSRPTPG
jgi:hypothetical protein